MYSQNLISSYSHFPADMHRKLLTNLLGCVMIYRKLKTDKRSNKDHEGNTDNR